MPNIHDRVEAIELKIVALRKVADGLEKELDIIKKAAQCPIPAIRNQKKKEREAEIEAFYMNRQITTKKIYQ